MKNERLRLHMSHGVVRRGHAFHLHFHLLIPQLSGAGNLYLTRLRGELGHRLGSPANTNARSSQSPQSRVITTFVSARSRFRHVPRHRPNCLSTFADIDECATGQACKDSDEMCQNTRGSFRCNRINCPSGYHRDNLRKK